MSLYPWLQNEWQDLISRAKQQRLPHGLLLLGPEGLGKMNFAENFAKFSLCKHSASLEQACGDCVSCHLWDVGNHPDILIVRPLEKSKHITIDQVRGIHQFLTLTPHLGKQKIVIVSPAHLMNRAAANSLLKSLEEPPADTLILLSTHKPSALLPTVRSRCQPLTFVLPRGDLFQSWLQQQLPEKTASECQVLLALANGAPLVALAFVQQEIFQQREAFFNALIDLRGHKSSVIDTAQVALKIGLEGSLYWMSSWVIDLVRLKFAPQPPMINNPDLIEPLRTIARQCSVQALLQVYQKLISAQACQASNPNPLLLIEDVLLSFAAIGNHS